MHRLLGPLALVVVALVVVPSASAAGWTCEASALRAQVLTAPAIEPAVANRGAECQEAGGGGAFAPALPLGLSADALSAQTLLEGPLTAPAQQRIARAQGTVADVGVKALPELPIPLPDPDFSDVDAIRIPNVGTIDLRPALEALIQPRSLPNVDLLRVRRGAGAGQRAVRRRRAALRRQLVARLGGGQRRRARPRPRGDRDGAADRLADDRPVERRHLADRRPAGRRPQPAPRPDPAGPERAPEHHGAGHARPHPRDPERADRERQPARPARAARRGARSPASGSPTSWSARRSSAPAT